MRLKNQYNSSCCACGRPVPEQQGFLIGKDPYLRRWMIRCQPCEHLIACVKPQPVAAGFFDQSVEGGT